MTLPDDTAAPVSTTEPAAATTEPAAVEPLHDDPAIAKALEGLTPEQRETLLTTGGKNALDARGQEAKRAKSAAASAKAAAEAAETARAELARTVGKALGLVSDDDTADPAKLAEQLTAQTSAARAASLELAVYKAAGPLEGDAVRLLDSRQFMAGLKDVDPTDADAVQNAIRAALEANPDLKTAPARRLPAPNPALGSSASGTPDLETQIRVAQKAGDWKTVVALQNQKLAATTPR